MKRKPRPLHDFAYKKHKPSGQIKATRGQARFDTRIPTPGHGKAEPEDVACAMRYKNITRGKLGIRSQWSVQNQAYHFRLLRTSYPNFRVVFDWYCERIKSYPQAIPYNSPKSLRSNWVNIMERYEKYANPVPDIEVSRTAKTIATRLLNLGEWPGSVQKQLPYLIQEGINDLTVFKKQVNQLLINLSTAREHLVQINKLDWAAKIKRNEISLTMLKENLPITYNYVEQWYQRIWEWGSKKESWRITPEMKFTTKHTEFQDFCDENCSRWKIVKEMLNES